MLLKFTVNIRCIRSSHIFIQFIEIQRVTEMSSPFEKKVRDFIAGKMSFFIPLLK